MLLTGPPGILQTMIARRIPLLLHKLGASGAASLRALYGYYNLEAAWKKGDVPPFRAPHHSVGAGAMWATQYRTGEIGMAAHGVLFLDEIQEFSPAVIRHTAEHVEEMRYSQAAPLVVASAAPCPCGWMKSNVRVCECSDPLILRYRSRIKERCDELSIDTIINVPSVSLQDMRDAHRKEPNPPIPA